MFLTIQVLFDNSQPRLVTIGNQCTLYIGECCQIYPEMKIFKELRCINPTLVSVEVSNIMYFTFSKNSQYLNILLNWRGFFHVMYYIMDCMSIGAKIDLLIIILSNSDLTLFSYINNTYMLYYAKDLINCYAYNNTSRYNQIIDYIPYATIIL